MTKNLLLTSTSTRKSEHLRINLEENVQFPRVTTGLEHYKFTHQALPELDIEKINTSLTLLTRKLHAPLLVSSMTGGTPEAQNLNLILAQAAQTHRIAMGVGSQRAALEDPKLAATFRVRSVAPDILLFANLGVIQLNYGYGLDECRRAVEMIEADALILHFNPLQEALQPEGNSSWAGLLKKIETICRNLSVPVIAKEVGWGFSQETAKNLVNAGIFALDVSGAGGTSWSEVEYHRAQTPFQARLARSFVDWGIPTATSLTQVRQAAPNTPLFASSGLKDGIDVAKCIALGASLGGFAGHFLRAAAQSPEALDEEIKLLTAQLRITMLCTGSQTLADLQKNKLTHLSSEKYF